MGMIRVKCEESRVRFDVFVLSIKDLYSFRGVMIFTH